MRIAKIGAVSVAQPVESIVDTKPVLIGVFMMMFYATFRRLYEQLFSWSGGRDSISTDFQLYGTSLSKLALLVSIGAAAALVSHLWRTRDRDLAKLSAALEIQRLHFPLQSLVFVKSLARITWRN
jgi:methane/ammonia monooxygenase subunit C